MTGFPEDRFEVAFAGHWDEEAKRRWRESVARADGMGMREGVFAKIGDSNIAAYNSLYGLGLLEPVWDRHAGLAPTMEHYRRVALPRGDDPGGQVRPGDGPCIEWNSFSRASAAARQMIHGGHLLEPSGRFSDRVLGWLPDSENLPDESMLHCELRVLEPRFAFVNIGTNGQVYGITPEESVAMVAQVVEEIIRLGTVPVVMTVPPKLDPDGVGESWEYSRRLSEGLREVARGAGVPMFDQWSAFADERLVNFGVVESDSGYFDGIHLETPGGFRDPASLERSVDFRPQALRYGANLRNLLLLMTLEALDQALEAG